MRNRERDELGEAVGPVSDRRVRGDGAPVVADEDRVAVGRERVGEREGVERDGRGLVVAVGREAGRRVPAEPRCDHVESRVRQLGHQVLPRGGVVREPVEADRERTVGGSGFEVRDIDVVDGDPARFGHGR